VLLLVTQIAKFHAASLAPPCYGPCDANVETMDRKGGDRVADNSDQARKIPQFPYISYIDHRSHRRQTHS
jgi:hypothetical protein